VIYVLVAYNIEENYSVEIVLSSYNETAINTANSQDYDEMSP